VRRDERSRLEHELVPVTQRQGGGIAAHAQAISKQGDSSVEAQQSSRPERQAPDREELAEASGAVEMNDACRRVCPLVRMTGRTADADARGDDDREAVREQLEVHALRRRARDGARSVHRRPRLIQRARADRRRYQHLIEAIALVGLLAGCGGGGGSGAPAITVGAARSYTLSGFEPAGPVAAGKPTRVSFTILQPDGKPLTEFKRGPGPHTGVHLIIVRRDLSTIVHEHPPVGANGRISTTITFPEPGPYRVVIDVYPQTAGPVPNFQEFAAIHVAGAYRPKPLPPLETSQTVDGYTITLHGRPKLRAIQPAFLHFTVTSPDGKPAQFQTWFGALAHAIFFRSGTLDYFHTHVCAPGASGCTSVFGAARVTGTSATPGRLDVGVLVPIGGTWRLFLQCRVDGHVLTTPFTLRVR
jgi:hypothetical protein